MNIELLLQRVKSEDELSLAQKAIFGAVQLAKTKEILAMSRDQLYKFNPYVTFDKNGNPQDRFRDNVWNYKGYSDTNTNKVNAAYNATFQSVKKIDLDLLNEFKMTVLHYFCNTYPSSCNARCAQAFCEKLSRVYKYLHKKRKASVTYLNDNVHLIAMLEKIGHKYSEQTLRNTLYSLNDITALRINNLDFSLSVDRGRLLSSQPINSIQQLAKKYSRKDKIQVEQTLCIPREIHAQMINNAFDMLVIGEKKIDDICNFFVEYYAVHKLSEEIERSEKKHSTRTKKKQDIRKNSIKRTPSKEHREQGIITRAELLEKHGLKGIDEQYAATGKGLLYYTNLIAASCYVLIGSFSGMREDEVLALKDDSFGRVGTKKRVINFLRSYETKVSGGQFVDYVTSPLVERPVKLMRKLHGPAKELIPELADNNFLFFSYPINRLPMYGEYGLADSVPKFIKHFDIRVTADDIEQHKIYNKKSSKDIKVGDLWPFATHQFRRTLAVNFIMHDIVGITEMKQQLKQMYSIMTEYYSSNVDVAKALKLVRSELFIKMLGEEKVELNVALYKRFFDTDEHLVGKKGEEIEKQRGLAKQLTDDEIRLLVEKGGFMVTWTMFGYCTKGKLCDKAHIVDPTVCGAKCETMIITYENALEWKKLYERNKELIKDMFQTGFENALSMMKAQNVVAEKIMNSFELKYEV